MTEETPTQDLSDQRAALSKRRLHVRRIRVFTRSVFIIMGLVCIGVGFVLGVDDWNGGLIFAAGLVHVAAGTSALLKLLKAGSRPDPG